MSTETKSNVASAEHNRTVALRWIDAFNARDDAAEAAARTADYIAHAPDSIETEALDADAWVAFLGVFSVPNHFRRRITPAAWIRSRLAGTILRVPGRREVFRVAAHCRAVLHFGPALFLASSARTFSRFSVRTYM